MNHIIVQPCGSPEAQKHFKNTIYNSVDLSIIRDLLSETDLNNLKEIYPDGKAQIWGVKPANQSRWNKLNKGDTVLFSGNNIIFMSATVTYKINNRKLAEKLWGIDEDDSWELIYFIDELKNQQIPYKVFNEVVQYSENYKLYRFSVLDDFRSIRFIEHFNLYSNNYFPEITEEDYLNELEREKEIEERITENRNFEKLEKQRVVAQRVEQSFLRNALFGNMRFSRCEICGRIYPVDLLIAAHIKRRANCFDEEKKDFKNNVVAMCRFGCDELFERGYISVKDGKVVQIKKDNISKVVQDYINKIVNKEVEIPTKARENYYEWHYKHHNPTLFKIVEK